MKRYLSAAEQVKGILRHFLSPVIQKAANLREFDRWQITMATINTTDSRVREHHRPDEQLFTPCTAGHVEEILWLGLEMESSSREDNTPYHKSPIVFDWFEENIDKMQLRCPGYLTFSSLETIGNIWPFIERHLRHPKHSCWNILTLRSHCLDICYNLSPVI
ncbi:hypothetical protein TNCV_2831711 [Trichonephila clavipes]|nr:hypothetical protein TNCV_2831711 [Trichonephila clavipes]